MWSHKREQEWTHSGVKVAPVSCKHPLSNACKAVPIPQRTEQITGNTFQISLQPDWQIDNGIFNRPIIAHTQIQALKEKHIYTVEPG